MTGLLRLFKEKEEKKDSQESESSHSPELAPASRLTKFGVPIVAAVVIAALRGGVCARGQG